jgi:hypothetical protein
MSLFNLGFVIAGMGSDPITIYTVNRGIVGSDGRQVVPSSPYTQRQAIANVQPVLNKTVKEVYGFQSDMEMVCVWTREICNNGDFVSIPGRGFFEVISRETWESTGNYQKYYCKISSEGEFKPL